MAGKVSTATQDQLLALATQTTTLAGSSTTLGGTITNAMTGQTASLAGVGQSQIAALGLVQGEQQKTVSATDVVAQVTGENVSLSDAILAQLKTPDASAEYLAKTIGLGNDYIAGRLDGIIAAINEQTAEQQAELKRQQDLTKAQAELEAVALQQKKAVSEVEAGISEIWALASKYGVYLNANQGAVDLSNSAKIDVNDKGLLEVVWGQNSFRGNKAHGDRYLEAYRNSGLQDRVFGRASELSTLAAQLDSYRQTIIDLGGVPAFHTGGYTGPGGKYEAAGVVHRGEVVFSQDDIARLGGVRAVEAIRTGEMPGYATGGVVGSANGPVVVPAPLVPGRMTMAPRPATPDPVQQEREAQARDQAQREAQQQTQDLIAQLRQVNSTLTELKRSVDKSGQSNDQMNNKLYNTADTTLKLLRKFEALGLPVVDVTPAKAAAEAA